MLRILLIRHGKTPGNAQGRYIGRTDESLSDAGKAELEPLFSGEEASREASSEASSELSSEASSEVSCEMHLFASPMKRCVETAACLLPGVEPTIVDAWREIDFGDFEGMNYQQLNGNPDYQAFIDSGGKTSFPNAESQLEFIIRSMRGWDEFCENLQKRCGENTQADYLLEKNGPLQEMNVFLQGPGKPQQLLQQVRLRESDVLCVLVVHGGTIMAILSQLLGGDYFSYQVKNGEGYLLTIGEHDLNK